MNAQYTEESLPAPPENLSFDQVALRFIRIEPAEPSRGFVPYYNFRILVGGDDVGHINFRVGETEHLVYAGHIGFQVIKGFRGHGYAFQACRAIAPLVSLIYPEVMITCDPDNTASRRTIERLGASFIEEIPVPMHDPNYQRGSRTKRRYRWKPGAPAK